MKPLLRLITLLMLIFASAVHAQDDTAPWPPDPSQIFAEGVEIVEETATPYILPTVTSSYFWEYYIDPETALTYLSKQGILSNPLPNDVSQWYDIYPSPSSNWLVLVGQDRETAGRGGPDRYYSYEVESETINYIGSLSSLDQMHFERWISDTEGLIYSGGIPEWAGKAFYYFDATESESLEMVITGRAQYHSDPPRYEYLNTHYKASRHADLQNHVPCTLDVFDLTMIASFTYELGYDCGGAFETHDGRYYYITFAEDPTQPATLYSLDIFTGDSIELMSGEFEALESISSDGRYVALIVDNSGQIDRAGMDPQFFTWDMAHEPRIIIFDLSTGTSIYQAAYILRVQDNGDLYENVAHSGMSRGSYSSIVTWVSDNSCIVRISAGTTIQSRRNALLTIKDNSEITEISLGSVVFILDRSRLLTWKEESDGEESLQVYDVTDNTWEPITIPLDREQFNVSVSDQIGNDILTLRLASLVNGRYDYMGAATYTIRLP
jgi:hypothetical protein